MRLKTTLKSGTCIASLFISLPSVAVADCLPDPAVDGQTITCSGTDPDGFTASPDASHEIRLEAGSNINGGLAFSGSGRITVVNEGNLNGDITGSAGSFILDHDGSLNGGVRVDGSGPNSMTIHAGRTLNKLGWLSGTENMVQNSGTLNEGIELYAETGAGRNQLIQFAGANLNSRLLMQASRSNELVNRGTLNTGIDLVGDGTSFVLNAEGATINNYLTSTGAARDLVVNAGLMNADVTLNEGDDIFISYGKTATGNRVIDFGAGRDILYMQEGKIGGEVYLGSGSDQARILAGEITPSIHGDEGDDLVEWSGGRVGGLDMGAGRDTATLTGLADELGNGQTLDGGTELDAMLWAGTRAGQVGRIRNWEVFALTEGSALSFDGNLVMGDSGTGTGALIIDETSVALAGNGNYNLTSMTGAGADLLNAGRIDLTDSAANTSTRFQIDGNLYGYDGRLRLDTVLGDSNSPSDVLVVNGGEVGGVTGIEVVNAGGTGGLTRGNGILVVDAINGAQTGDSAFYLPAPVAAGPFEYLLFRGGKAAGTDENWYLRNAIWGILPDGDLPDIGGLPHIEWPHVPELPEVPDRPTDPVDPIDPVDPDKPPVIVDPVDPPVVDPVDPPVITPIDPEVPPDPENPDTGGSDPDVVTPIVRPEIGGDVVAPLLARELGLNALGTFHSRRGDQLVQGGYLEDKTPVWGRIFGQHREFGWTRSTLKGSDYDIGAEFDGKLWGLQVGADLWMAETDGGAVDRGGLYYAHSRGSGDVSGNALLQTGIDLGSLDLTQHAFGAYWTRVDARGWYVDAVAQLGLLDGDTSSHRGIGAEIDGTNLALSLEAGQRYETRHGLWIEPQAQLIWQRTKLDDSADAYAAIDYDAIDTTLMRIGTRIEYPDDRAAPRYLSHVGFDLWHALETTEQVRFDGHPVSFDTDSTVLEITGGISHMIAADLRSTVEMTYSRNLQGDDHDGYGIVFGLTKEW